MPGVHRGQKSASNPLELDLQMVVSHRVGCWKSEPNPLEKQPVLLTAESHIIFNYEFSSSCLCSKNEARSKEGEPRTNAININKREGALTQ